MRAATLAAAGTDPAAFAAQGAEQLPENHCGSEGHKGQNQKILPAGCHLHHYSINEQGAALNYLWENSIRD